MGRHSEYHKVKESTFLMGAPPTEKVIRRALRLAKKYRIGINAAGRKKLRELYDANFEWLLKLPGHKRHCKVEKELQFISEFFVWDRAFSGCPMSKKLSDTSWAEYFAEAW